MRRSPDALLVAVLVLVGAAGHAAAQPVKPRTSILIDSSASMLTTPEIVTWPETCAAFGWNGCTSSGNPSPAQETCNACMAWTIRTQASCATTFTTSGAGNCRDRYDSCWEAFNGSGCAQVLGVTAAINTRGDGTVLTPGCDVDGDGLANDSRMYQVKEALQDVVATSSEVELALWRFAQIEGGQSCTTDGQCPDTPTNQSYLTCESVASTNRCALDATAYGSAAGLCNQFSWTGAGNTFSCAQCSEAGAERLQCEAYGLGQVRTGGTTPLGSVNCALPTVDHPYMMNHGAFALAGGCDPSGGERLVDFPITASLDNRPAILAWIDHQQPNLATDVEINAHGGAPIAASLRDLRTAVLTSAQFDSHTPCRKHQVIAVLDGGESCESASAAVTAAASLQNLAFTNVAGVMVTDYDVRVHVIGLGICPPAQPNCQTRTDLNAIAAAGGTGTAIMVNGQAELQVALAQIVANSIVVETCNGLDDDCDGTADDGVCVDAGIDAPIDAPADAPTDAPADAPTDAPADAPADAPTDAPADAPTDAIVDADVDAGIDAPTDAPTDAPEVDAADVDAGIDASPMIDASALDAADVDAGIDASPALDAPALDAAAADAGGDAAPDGGCCGTAPGPAPSLGLLVALVGLALTRRRRRV